MNLSGASPAGEESAGTRAPVPTSSEKTLRACVVQGGKVIEEQRLRRRQPLTIGNGPKNTFVVADPSLPKSHQLFAVRGGTYELVLTEGMRGKLSIDNNVVDFANLKSQGLLKKRGAYYHLPLNDQHRGKVILGEVTVIFQFVVPPPEPVKPQLPAAARGSIKDRIDWPYAAALLFAFVMEMPLLVYFQYAPKPTELTIDTIDDRWAKLIVPDRKTKQKIEPPKAKGPSEEKIEKKEIAKAKEEPKEETPDAQKAKAAAKRQKIRESVAGKGILAILGTAGAGGASGAVADVFGSGNIGGDLDSAFEGISGVGLATGGERTTRGGGSGEAASIGGLATAGGGKVGLEGKKESRVAAVKTEAPEVDGSLDSSAIAEVVRKRIRSIQDCYERELKRDSSLQGKIEIEFTIGASGAVDDVRVSNNRMGSEAVADCIASRIKRWRFPQPDGGSVTVNYPFIFTPSS